MTAMHNQYNLSVIKIGCQRKTLKIDALEPKVPHTRLLLLSVAIEIA